MRRDLHKTHRRRIDLSDTRAFSTRSFSGELPVERGLRWARLAVWDIAGNEQDCNAVYLY